jgi:hypothetical protein
MPGWAWALIVIGAVVILGAVVLAAFSATRTRRLKSRFGPEYDRTVDRADGRRAAEAELKERERRRARFDIRPLDPASRDRYVEDWGRVQAQFVDDPVGAVGEADLLIRRVMGDRGYPVEDFEQRAADLSVDHPRVVEHYREGHALAQNRSPGAGSTEDLRQAMRHFRDLFEELVEDVAATPMTRDPAPQETAAEQTTPR